jgi:SAM-dependent methyltransferase
VRGLRVGNFLRERDASRGFSIQEKILNGGDEIGFLGGRLTIPSTILGINPTIPGVKPARNWEDLKTQYRSHRLFLSTLPPDHEDGYNLALLEAMATGMPVVALANPSCPVVDGENGFVSDDPRILRGRIIELLRNPDLACQLGELSRRTVMEQFGIDRFVAEWERILHSAGDRGSLSLPAPVENTVPLAVASEDCSLLAWSAADVGWAIGGCPPDEFHLLGVRLERLSPERWWGELIAFRSDRRRPMIWRGVTITAGDGDSLSLGFPPCLAGLPPYWREDVAEWVERGVLSFLSDPVRRKAPRGILESPLQSGIEPFDETWIVPDDSDARSYLRRARRYCWASGFAEDRVVLDLGCGVGDGSRLLARRARRVVGVDSDHRAASFANLSYGDERLAFQAADAGCLPFAGGSFGLVVAVGLSSSSSGFFETLGEALRVLTPSGRLALSCRLEERKTVAAWLEERFEAVTFWGQRPELGRAEITDEFAIETLGGNDESFVALAESPRIESEAGVGTVSPGEELWRFPEPLLALHSAAAPGANGK